MASEKPLLLPENEKNKYIHLTQDGEVTRDNVSASALLTDNSELSLEALMEESGLITQQLTGLGTWKLDKRIGQICERGWGETYDVVESLVRLTDRYQALLSEIDNIEEEYCRYHVEANTERDLTSLLIFCSAALPFLIGLGASEIISPYIVLLDLLIILALVINTVTTTHKKLKNPRLFITPEEQLSKTKEEKVLLAPLEQEAQDIYGQIKTHFQKLEIKWYLRNEFFPDTLEHIRTIFLNTKTQNHKKA